MMAGRFPEQVTQVPGHRVHAAQPAQRRYVAVRPDQDEGPGAGVTISRSLRWSRSAGSLSTLAA
jgi:hypothetical protein